MYSGDLGSGWRVRAPSEHFYASVLSPGFQAPTLSSFLPATWRVLSVLGRSSFVRRSRTPQLLPGCSLPGLLPAAAVTTANGDVTTAPPGCHQNIRLSAPYRLLDLLQESQTRLV